jgi:two-component system CheB/CheR fusion protein
VPAAPRPAARSLGNVGGYILVVDDYETNRRLISTLLKRCGSEIVAAVDGQDACEKARAARDEGKPFDAILMDMAMPVMDGYTAAATLRGEGFTCPIIALTAHAMRGDDEKCIKAGCSDYLSKPVDPDKVIATVTAAMQRAKGGGGGFARAA